MFYFIILYYEPKTLIGTRFWKYWPQVKTEIRFKFGPY